METKQAEIERLNDQLDKLDTTSLSSSVSNSQSKIDSEALANVNKELTELQTTCKKFSDSVVRLEGISGLITRSEQLSTYFRDVSKENPSLTYQAQLRIRGCFEVLQTVCN